MSAAQSAVEIAKAKFAAANQISAMPDSTKPLDTSTDRKELTEAQAMQLQQTGAFDEDPNVAAAKVAANNGAPIVQGAAATGMTNLANVAQQTTTTVATPNANGAQNAALAAAEQIQTSREVAASERADRAVLALQSARNYEHIFAGANAIMPDGKKITFAGRPGTRGYYTTTKAKEIQFLDELSTTSGSQISSPELRGRTQGEYDEYHRDLAEATRDANANAARENDPNIVAARANLPKLIAAN